MMETESPWEVHSYAKQNALEANTLTWNVKDMVSFDLDVTI